MTVIHKDNDVHRQLVTPGNQPHSQVEREALRQSVRKGTPLGTHPHPSRSEKARINCGRPFFEFSIATPNHEVVVISVCRCVNVNEEIAGHNPNPARSKAVDNSCVRSAIDVTELISPVKGWFNELSIVSIYTMPDAYAHLTSTFGAPR